MALSLILDTIFRNHLLIYSKTYVLLITIVNITYEFGLHFNLMVYFETTYCIIKNILKCVTRVFNIMAARN